jgi:hypothetical protein
MKVVWNGFNLVDDITCDRHSDIFYHQMEESLNKIDSFSWGPIR